MLRGLLLGELGSLAAFSERLFSVELCWALFVLDRAVVLVVVPVACDLLLQAHLIIIPVLDFILLQKEVIQALVVRNRFSLVCVVNIRHVVSG